MDHANLNSLNTVKGMNRQSTPAQSLSPNLMTVNNGSVEPFSRNSSSSRSNKPSSGSNFLIGTTPFTDSNHWESMGKSSSAFSFTPSSGTVIKKSTDNSSSIATSNSTTTKKDGPVLKVPVVKSTTTSLINSKISVAQGKYALYDEMKAWRLRYAEENGVEPFRVFSNKVLDAIMEDLPETEYALSQIKGVGNKTVNKISAKLLPLVKCVVAGKPFPEGMTMNMISTTASSYAVLDADKAVVAAAASKTKVAMNKVQKSARSAQLAEILARIENQHIIQEEELNVEQNAAAKQVLKNGCSLFITGSAGTGKSFLLQYIVQELKSKYGERCVAVTASTGIAAVNLGGGTLHSFAGIGLANGSGDKEKTVQKVMKNKKTVERWLDAKVLVIDEISMIDKSLFELLDLVARRVKGIDAPFGGLQVLLVGDFLQLPPVPNRYGAREFCFESQVWDDLSLGNGSQDTGFNGGNVVNLHEVIRQKSDQDFISLLNEVRMGNLSNKHLKALNKCLVSVKAPPTDGIVPTKLYSINRDVDKENLDRLHELPSDMVEIDSYDFWSERPTGGTSAKRVILENANRSIPQSIQLKVGAQVMLVRNRGDSSSKGTSALVNGSRGVVTGFVESASAFGGLVPRVCFDNGMEIVVGPAEYVTHGAGGDGQHVRMQVPLKLAWAVTIHKSQGSTLSRVELMLTNTFDYGQAYVALSRVTSMEGLWLTHPLRRDSVKANPLVMDYFKYDSEKLAAATSATGMEEGSLKQEVSVKNLLDSDPLN